MACARTVAVVVPSPATSEVLEATSRTIWAPMFSSPSFNSISFATVTPSLVMVGDPNFFSITTLRPLGPRVTFTASARILPPRSDGFFLGDARQHAENFLFLHNQEIFAVNLDFSAVILGEQDVVSLFHRQREHLAVFIAPALAHGDDFALLRLVLSTVRYEDSAASGCRFFYATNQDAVVQRGEFRSHTCTPFYRFLSDC